LKISIETNFPEVQRRLAQLQDGVARQAAARAVTRTLEQGRTAMSREIRGEFNLSATKVNQALRVNRASTRGGLAGITGSLESPSKRGRSLNLINFAARQTRQGVTVKVSRKGPRKLIRGAFIANGGRTVFIRTGKMRLPIKALQTIDVAQMFNTRRLNGRVTKGMLAKFPEIFARESKFYIDRFNSRAAQ